MSRLPLALVLVAAPVAAAVPHVDPFGGSRGATGLFGEARFDDALPEGPSVPAAIRLDGPSVGFAARLERVEVRVLGPAGAPLLVLAGALPPDAAAPEFDPHAFVVLADGRGEAGARLDAVGAWSGRWPVPEALPLGQRLVVAAYALEPAGWRELGTPLVLEVVDQWSFDFSARAEGDDAGYAGWSATFGSDDVGRWRARAFGVQGSASYGAGGRGAAGRIARAELWIDAEIELEVDAAAVPLAFLATAPKPHVGGDARAHVAWLSASLPSGTWRVLERAVDDPAAAPGDVVRWVGRTEARLGVPLDGNGRAWLVVGGGPGTRAIELTRVRVVLTAPR